MSEPFIGEIRMFPYAFAPRYWAYCMGQVLPISQNDVLYAVIGTTYGGDGMSTLGLPKLSGRVPMHPGQGPGLSNYQLGQLGGFPQIKLYKNNLPNHRHAAQGARVIADSNAPNNTQFPGTDTSDVVGVDVSLYGDAVNLEEMDDSALASAGGMSDGSVQAHENRQPYLCVPFCIALEGDFPPRN